MKTPLKKEDYCNAEELALWAEYHRLANISEPLERLIAELKARIKEARRAERATDKAWTAARNTPGGAAYMAANIARYREERAEDEARKQAAAALPPGAVLMFEHGTASVPTAATA